jgi:3-oxoacyl-[acyl-carrier-protein] synthase II
MSSQRQVVITGIGLLCPLGDSAQSLHAGLCRGKSDLASVGAPESAGRELPPSPGGPLASDAPDRYLNGRNAYPLDRPARLLVAAAQLALDNSGWSPCDVQQQDFGLFVGTMFSSAHTISRFDCQTIREGPAFASPLDFANTVINAPAGQTAIWHSLRGVNSTIATGASAGLEAIGCATEAIKIGRASCLLAGGVEELSQESATAFSGAGLLCGANDRPRPFIPECNGLALSEGAALLMLEEKESAERRGARVVAEVCGYGHAFDVTRRRDEKSSLLSIDRSMRAALAEAAIKPEDIDVVCVSANGIAIVDRHEAIALSAVFGTEEHMPPVSAVKVVLGEPLGAAGPLQCIAMIEAMRSGVVPLALHLQRSQGSIVPSVVHATPIRANIRTCLVNALSFDGHSCSLVLASV